MTTAYTSSLLAETEPGNDPFFFEKTLMKQGFTCVGGVDEAGRGPLAGPVVAACAVLPDSAEADLYIDSKQLSATRREELYAQLYQSDAAVGVGIVDARDIERLNILQAALHAMKIAVMECNGAMVEGEIDFLLVDGTFNVPVPVTQQALVKGESRSRSIAAASIVAKVTRDKLMADYHQQYPHYNFIKNQGYPTAEHREAIKTYGPCPLHRRTFKGVREFCHSAEEHPTARQKAMW